MRSLKSILFLVVFLAAGFFVGSVPGASAATVTVGQTASKSSSTYFYYAPGARNAYSVINSAINAAASGASAGSHGVVNIESSSSPYITESHILAKSYVDIVGASRDGVKLKIASGITPTAYGGPGTTGWGGVDSAESEGAIINVWSGVTNVKIANITLDGSCGDYYSCGTEVRGKYKFALMNVYRAPNVLVENVKFTQGMSDGIIARGDNLEVANSLFDMIGHDGVEGYNVKNMKVHHSIIAMRTNSGVRCSGDGDGCYIYDNEFYTGSGGGAAVELQDGAKNVKIYNNYFHDISGASGSYGAIGYPGQSPSGSGHEYYNNLFVNCTYAIAHVPSSAVSHNNIIIDCGTAVGGGTDTNNIKTLSGYSFNMYGVKGAGNTNWMVASGPLATAFAGIKVGIESAYAGVSGGTLGTTYTMTVNNGVGGGTYSAGDEVTIVANLPATGTTFDKWLGDLQYITPGSYINTFVMPAANIAFAATYTDPNVPTYTLTVNNGTGGGSYAAGEEVTIVANLPSAGTEFSKWTGDTGYISSTTSYIDTFNMPAKAISFTAVYTTPTTATTSALTVNNGSGDGAYASGTKVTITANSPASGKIFDKWSGDTSYLSSIYTSVALVTMPAKAITLTATYKTGTTTVYTLKVNGGEGSGAYLSGTDVIVIANVPPAGKTFDKWTGDTAYVSSPSSLISSVTMPAKNITLTATYKAVAAITAYVLTVTNGIGDGSYATGTKVSITAEAPAIGKVFDKWMGDTNYVSNVSSATTTVTMPAKAITLVAAYKNTVSSATFDYPDGTLIKLPDSPKVYVIIDGEKKWIPIPEVFTQLGYEWTDIKVVNQAQLDIFLDFEDNLIRLMNDFKVFLVVNGMKRHIPNPTVFLDYGFSWDDVKDVDETTMNRYRSAILLKETNTNDVYFLNGQGVRKLIPSAAVFDSYGNKWEDVQIVSKTEMESHELTNLIRLQGSPDVYLVTAGKKMHISSAALFNQRGFKWENVIEVNSTEFNFYPNGGDLK